MKRDTESYPTVTLVIITKNVQRTIGAVLKSIQMQKYPNDKIDILVIDGDSTDRTLDIIKASKQNITIVQSNYPNDPEACRGVGLQHAKGEVIGFIDSDNYLPHKHWLKNITTPFVVHKEIVGAQALRYGYRRKDSALNRYFALIGSGDPVGFYLKKADRLSYLYDRWNLYGKIVHETNAYYLIQFTPDHFPTLGSNAFFARKRLLKKAKSDPLHYFHIDVPLDLAMLGYNTYAIIKDEIIHDTAVSFYTFLKKRVLYMRLYYDKRAADRRYKVFDPSRIEDIVNLLLFIFFSITLLQPLFFSIRGYIKKRDIAWFLHPIFCLSITAAYAIAMLFRYGVKSKT